MHSTAFADELCCLVGADLVLAVFAVVCLPPRQHKAHTLSTPHTHSHRAHEASLDARCEELIEECGNAKRAAAASAASARTTSVAACEQAQRLANAEGAAQAAAQRLEAARADAKAQVCGGRE